MCLFLLAEQVFPEAVLAYSLIHLTTKPYSLELGSVTPFEKKGLSDAIKRSEMRFLWAMWVGPKPIPSVLTWH